MREFTDDEKFWLVYHENTLSLQQHAKHFNTSVANVYNVYSDILESGEYKPLRQRCRIQRQHIFLRRKIRKILERRLLREGERNFDAISLQTTKSRPYIRGIRTIQVTC